MVAEWDERFISLARYIADKWSKDPSTKVGAVLVDPRRNVIGTGYNGFPRGVDDASERLNDRDTKYEFTVHAEMNAILTASASALGATLYCSHPPCASCTKHAIQVGIKRIVAPAMDMARWTASRKHAEEMMREAGVQFDLVEMPT